jgi:hypothetical protein
MPKRRSKRRSPVTTGFSDSVLHYFASGELLPQAEGEAKYGPSFDWTDCYTPEAHPRAFQAAWETHRAAIEAHARLLGVDGPPWIARVLDGEEN